METYSFTEDKTSAERRYETHGSSNFPVTNGSSFKMAQNQNVSIQQTLLDHLYLFLEEVKAGVAAKTNSV